MDRRLARSETKTSSFGVGRREGHDASAFYQRFTPPALSDDDTINRPPELISTLGSGALFEGSIDELQNLPDNSVALVVTSPPYFVGKDYELAVDHREVPATYLEFLDGLRSVFAECRRVLEPGGRIAVNVANLGRKPYRSLSADVISILQDDLGLLLRGEVIWEKASATSGSCAWGSFGRASNPVLRDVSERVIVACKGRFARAVPAKARQARGLPHRSSLTNDEFVDVTRDIWRIDAESARRVGHPAPFPIELPRRLIDLYTYVGDLVVDPFVGSGTTVIAAARSGRIGIGYDTDPGYLDLARRRLEAEGDETGDRRERAWARAVGDGKKMHDIARRFLTEAGFASVEAPGRPLAGLVDLAFAPTGADGGGWLVEVVGGFTTPNPGLQRVDAVWRLLGRLNVVRALDPRPVLVLTSSRPKPGSAADRALRAVGPGVVHDVVEPYDEADLDRLRAYATGTADGSQPGFWTPTEIDDD